MAMKARKIEVALQRVKWCSPEAISNKRIQLSAPFAIDTLTAFETLVENGYKMDPEHAKWRDKCRELLEER